MKLLTVRHAAKESGIGYTTLKNLVRGGALKSVLLPGMKRPMVDMDDLVALVEASKVGTKRAPIEETTPVQIVANAAPKERCPKIKIHWDRRTEAPYYEKYARRSNA